MEESYKTTEAELTPPRTEASPQKPVRQIRRSEMYATRKVKEEVNPVLQQPVPKSLHRVPSLPTSLHKCVPEQNVAQVDAPWENVTLNRCLFVAIAILVVTSGFQRLHETLRGQRAPKDENVGLRERRSSVLRQRAHVQESQKSLWEVIFWWLQDLDEDDGNTNRSKRKAVEKSSRGFRNRPHPDPKLTKQREGKLKGRRAKRDRDMVKERKKGSKRFREGSGKENEQKEMHINVKRLEEREEDRKLGDDVKLST